VAGGLVDLSEGGDRAARRYGDDSGRAASCGLEGARLFRSASAVRALLVYGDAYGHFAAVCMLGLQCGERGAARGVSVGRRVEVIVGEDGLGVEAMRPILDTIPVFYSEHRLAAVDGGHDRAGRHDIPLTSGRLMSRQTRIDEYQPKITRTRNIDDLTGRSRTRHV